MATSEPIPSPSDPAVRDALVALMACGVRIAQAAAQIAEAEAQIVTLTANGLPAHLEATGSLHDAQMAGLAVDAADGALAHALPRIATASQSFERVARAVRRTAALIQRIDHGWMCRVRPDDRQAMARRHIARGVGDRIARQADREAAERLFDDLDERLDMLEREGGLDQPAEDIIAAICRDLGLAAIDDPVTPAPAEAVLAPSMPQGHDAPAPRRRSGRHASDG
jgi:hypothetical protein